MRRWLQKLRKIRTVTGGTGVVASPRIADRVVGRDNNFNLLRMMAATGVLVSHAYPVSRGPDTEQLLEYWLKGVTLGDACVLVFFVISGFFIARSFDQKQDLRAFLWARVLRIFPALAIVLVLSVLVTGLWLTATPGPQFWQAGAEYVLRNVTLISPQRDLPGVFEGNPFGPVVNSSLWTLYYEVMCYLWVVCVGLVGWLAGPRIFVLVLAVFVTAFGAKVALDLAPRLETGLYLGLPFVIGMTFYVWRAVIPLSGFLAVGLIGAAAVLWSTPLFSLMMILALCYTVFVLGYARIPSLLRYNRVGDYSYGTYIYAFPIQQTVVWMGVTSPVLNIVLAAPVTLLCAILSWRLVEAPALRLRHRIWRPAPG